MRWIAAILALGIAGSAQAGLQFECTSIHSSALAPCSEPAGAFVADLGPLDTYDVTLPSGHVSHVTLADETWAAGGTYELVFLDSFSVMELYLYGTGSGGFTTRLWYTFGGPDTTGAARDWQALGTWGVISVPEPGTLAAILAAALALAFVRRKA